MIRVKFTTVWVNDEDKAIEFYQGKLGFELLVDNPTEFGGRFLLFQPSGGGAQMAMSRPLPGSQTQPGGWTNVALETDDLHGTYEALRAKGVEFTQPPTKRFWGGVEARFVDPDGNEFLIQQIQG